MNWPFEGLYGPDDRDARIFGDIYTPPAKFVHGEWHEVARIKAIEGGDGQECVISECRLPARFFKLEALAGADSMGQPKAAYEVTTGSGDEVGALLLTLARQISQGMIGFRRATEVSN